MQYVTSNVLLLILLLILSQCVGNDNLEKDQLPLSTSEIPTPSQQVITLKETATPADITTPPPTDIFEHSSVVDTSTLTPSITADTPTPSKPVIHKQLTRISQIGGRIGGIASQGDYIYLGIGPRLVIIDISNPKQPAVIGQTEVLPGDNPIGLTVMEDIAYVTTYGTDTLYIIDVSDPTSPMQIGSFHNSGYGISDVTVTESRAYLLGWGGDLQIIDVSEPTHPRKLSSFEQTNASKMATQHNRVFLLDQQEGLTILDISNVGNPTVIGTHKMQGRWLDLVVKDNHAYITDGVLQILDISKPGDVREIGFYGMSGRNKNKAPSRLTGIIPVNDLVYAVSSNGLHVLNVSDPTTPQEIGYYEFHGGGIDIAINDNIVYLVKLGGGLELVDISTPTAPVTVSTYNPPQMVQSLAEKDGYVYLLDEQGLHVVDASNQTILSQIGFYDLYRDSKQIVISRDIAYIISDNHLYLADISDPTELNEISSYSVPQRINKIEVKEGFVYLTEVNGLRVVNVSDSTQPREASFYMFPHAAGDIAVEKNVAFVATQGGMYLMDVSTPAIPREITFYDDLGEIIDVWVDDAIAYVTVPVENDPYNIKLLCVIDLSITHISPK